MSDQSGPSAEEVLAVHFGEAIIGPDGERFNVKCHPLTPIEVLRAACGDPSGWVVIGPDGRLYTLAHEPAVLVSHPHLGLNAYIKPVESLR